MINKKLCCGCEACSRVCKRHAIEMKADNEGFLYPVIDRERCNNCNACINVCPFQNRHESQLNSSQKYGVKNKNITQRISSSSGGVFPIFAYELVKQNYYVVGAAYNSEWQVEHVIVNNENGVKTLLRSKYVQSHIGDIYDKIKELLLNGEKVLFSGTPCQASALKLFLRKEYDNLYIIDLICHGVPSPMVWEKYLKDKSEEYGETIDNIIDVSFKVKDESKQYVWRRPGFRIKWKSGKTFSSFGNQTSYENGFLSNLFVRPSCHNCHIKKISSGADITIGDFWGGNIVKPDFDDKYGVSLIFVNTPKGKQLFSDFKDKFVFIPLITEEALYNNERISMSSLPHRNRTRFFELGRIYPLDVIVPQLLKQSLIRKFVKKSKSIINLCLRKIADR